MADFEANIGAMSGLGGFATALPGAIDEWIKNNEAQRQFESQGRLAAALAPFQEQEAASKVEMGRLGLQMEGQKVNYMANALQGAGQGAPMTEAQRNVVGLKGQDPQVIMQQKALLEQLKQAGLFEKQNALLHEQDKLIQGRADKAKANKPPSYSQVLGGILQAKIDGKMSPGQEAAWRMAHPIDGKILDQAEKSLKDNPAYQMALISGDMKTVNTMRQDAIDRISAQYGVTSQPHEEAEEEEEGVMTPEDLSMWERIKRAWTSTDAEVRKAEGQK
jgi:hypothetical protein